MGGFDSLLSQHFGTILNSVFCSLVVILRVILFESAFNSVQLKKNLFELTL